jgi:release factor glutamine methyltransferase
MTSPRDVRAPAPQPQVWTVETVLQWATDDFRSRGLESPRIDAELLIGHALSATRIELIVHSRRVLDADELGRIRTLVQRRRAHEPIAYILGEREFYGRVFRVDRRVLVPRPDTETLVAVAIERTRALSMSMRALDLCTGGGCVAITLARERPTSSVVACDVSPEALAVARDNALRLGAYNIAFRAGDLYSAIEPGSRFDLVTANAPYIPAGEIASLPPDVRNFEPLLALDGGEDGLRIVRSVVLQAPEYLRAGGLLAVEVAAGQAPSVAELFERASFGQVQVRRDYGRIERVVSGVLERSVPTAMRSAQQ